jgi:hypothetical protein
MSPPTSPSSSDLASSIDSDPTPRASRYNPPAAHKAPPPRVNFARVDDAPLQYSDDDFGEQERRWRESRPLIRHVPPPLDQQSDHTESDAIQTLRALERRRRTSSGDDINLDDWVEWIGVWLLACMVVLAVTGAAAMIWILVR